MREPGRTESQQSGHQDTRTHGSPGSAGRKMPSGRAERPTPTRRSPPEPSRNREEQTGPREGTKPAPRHGPPGDPSAREHRRRRTGPVNHGANTLPSSPGLAPTSPQRHPAARGTQPVEGGSTGRGKPPPGTQEARQQPPDAPENAPGGVLRPLRAGSRFQGTLEGAKGPSRANQGHLKAYSRQGARVKCRDPRRRAQMDGRKPCWNQGSIAGRTRKDAEARSTGVRGDHAYASREPPPPAGLSLRETGDGTGWYTPGDQGRRRVVYSGKSQEPYISPWRAGCSPRPTPPGHATGSGISPPLARQK